MDTEYTHFFIKFEYFLRILQKRNKIFPETKNWNSTVFPGPQSVLKVRPLCTCGWIPHLEWLVMKEYFMIYVYWLVCLFLFIYY